MVVNLIEEKIEETSYVRSIEVLSLCTLARLLQFRYQKHRFALQPFDIFERRYIAEAETAEIVLASAVRIFTSPVWKICVEEQYFIDELGYTEKSTLKGIECWPEFGGKYHIRHSGKHFKLHPKEGAKFVLLGGDTNHYHWVLNFLPRLLTMQEVSENLNRQEYIYLVPDNLSANALELLRFLGVEHEQILPLPRNAIVEVDSLIVPSLFPTTRLSPNIFKWYRTVTPRQEDNDAPRRLYIGRSAGSTVKNRRVVANEDEVLSELRRHDFVNLDLASLSMAEQIRAFQHADFVVGPHGAGFANFVFARPDTKAIIFENSWNHTFMADLVTVGGCTSRILPCDDVIDEAYEAEFQDDQITLREVRRNRDMVVPIDGLRRQILELMGPG